MVMWTLRYDVSALFTSVPVDKVLDIIWKILEEDEMLTERMPLVPNDIITLLDKYLRCTHFLYKGEYYLQIHVATMG